MPLQFNPFTGTFDVTTKGDTGNVSAAGDGTAAAPGITFASDTNTGIYRPGEDQLALSTGGSGRLFVDASGNVGINTTPSSLGTSVTTLEVKGGSTTRSGGLRVSSSDSSVKGAFYIYDGAGVLGTESATPLDLYTGNSPRLRITSAGLVGIGFSSPATPVDCRTSGRPGYLLVTSDTGTSNQYAFSNGSNFHAGVVGTVTGNTTNSGDVFGLGYAASVVNDDFTPVLTWTANTNRVGIGTQTPALKLSVDGDLWNGNGFGAEVGRLFNDPGGVYHLLASSNMAGLAFGTNGTEKARIDNSGRLLVGTSNARSNFFNGTLSAIFQVEGANAGNNRNSSFVYGQSNASGPIINLGKHRSDSVGGITVVAADDQIGSIAFQGSDGTDFVAGAQISAFVDGTPGADDMPGRLVFSTTADGAASPTERLRITSAGVLQVADAGNIAVGTTTGTKIGTATTQKLGFFNKTPVVQPAAVADATDAASVITQLNALLARMRDLGLIAT